MREKNRNLALIIVSFAVGMCYFIPYIRFSFYDQTLEVFSINNTQMGILGSVFGAVAIVCYLISGFLAEKLQPRILMAVSCFACAVITIWLTFIPKFPQLVIIYILFAFFTIATLWSPYLVFIRNLGSSEEQGRLLGISESARNVFSTVAGIGSVYLFGRFVIETAGYKAMLYAAIVLYILFGILCLYFLPEIKNEEIKTEKEKSGLLRTLKIPGVWLMGFFMFSCYTAIITQTNYMGTYTTQVLGVSANLSSLFAVMRNYIIPIGAGIIGGYVVDKAKSRPAAFAVIMFIFGILMLIIPNTEGNLVWNMVLTMFVSLTAFMTVATYWAIMDDCGIPLECTAIASGIVSGIAYIPDAFVTYIIGGWLDADSVGGFQKMFIWMAVWAFVATALALIIHLRLKYRNK